MRSFSIICPVILLAATLGGVGCAHKASRLTVIPSNESPVTGVDTGNGGLLASPAHRVPDPANPVNPTVPPGRTPVADADAGRIERTIGTGGNGDRGLTSDDPSIGHHREPTMFSGSTVYFEYDRSSVNTETEKAKVLVVAEYLEAHPSTNLEVGGHCDDRGTEGYNLALSERRALAVREILLNHGVTAKRMITTGYGEARPAERGHDEATRSRNRRAEFVLLLPDEVGKSR